MFIRMQSTQIACTKQFVSLIKFIFGYEKKIACESKFFYPKIQRLYVQSKFSLVKWKVHQTEFDKYTLYQIHSDCS